MYGVADRTTSCDAIWGGIDMTEWDEWAGYIGTSASPVLASMDREPQQATTLG